MPTEALRVAVLAGGDSAEREVSLASGARVAEGLRAAGHRVRSIDPAQTDLAGVDWGLFDACFLALHGGAGEDGRVQEQLERRHVPYTGSGPAASRAAMSKSAAKAIFRQRGVPTPESVLLEQEDGPEQVLGKVAGLGFPLVIKPDAQGSSLGVAIVRDAGQLPGRVAESRRYDPRLIAERFIAGREFTVAVLGREPMPLLEIAGFSGIFDYRSKYTSTSIEYHFQTGLPPIKVEELQQTAVRAAAALGTAGLVRVDLMLDEHLRPWVLEVNTLPGMTGHSLAPLAAARAGMDLPALCDRLLRESLHPAERR